MAKQPDRLSWITDNSRSSIRSALRQAAPQLADGSIVVRERPLTTRAFFQGTAVVDEAYVVKFAWAEPPAWRLVHEAIVLDSLQMAAPGLPIPRVVAWLADPVILITRRVPGVSLFYPGRLGPIERTRLAQGLGRFLAALHDPGLLATVRVDVPGPPPQPQADTAAIRARFPRFVTTEQAAIVFRFCDLADGSLGPTQEEAVLHGDLHGDNLVLNPQTCGLRLVADFESSTVGDPNFDFRYLPDVSRGVDFFCEVVTAYEAATGRSVDVPRVLGWHIRTMLGDALWRSEAGVPLPGGGTPADWVDELAIRMQRLDDRLR